MLLSSIQRLPLTRSLRHHSKCIRPRSHGGSESNRIFWNAKRTASSAGAGVGAGSFHSIQEEIDDANERFDGTIAIRGTTDRGWGVHATRPQRFQRGEKILSSAVLSESSVRHSHTVQVGWERHVVMDLPARFINHSCDANVGVRDNEASGAYDFFAIRDIEPGEELLWDYEAAEYEISAFEKCLCGSPKCRKILGGFKMNGDKIRELYGEYYANYLKEG